MRGAHPYSLPVPCYLVLSASGVSQSVSHCHGLCDHAPRPLLAPRLVGSLDDGQRRLGCRLPHGGRQLPAPKLTICFASAWFGRTSDPSRSTVHCLVSFHLSWSGPETPRCLTETFAEIQKRFACGSRGPHRLIKRELHKVQKLPPPQKKTPPLCSTATALRQCESKKRRQVRAGLASAWGPASPPLPKHPHDSLAMDTAISTARCLT